MARNGNRQLGYCKWVLFSSDSGGDVDITVGSGTNIEEFSVTLSSEQVEDTPQLLLVCQRKAMGFQS